jgi:paired amphipathic helix protein Sin3a
MQTKPPPRPPAAAVPQPPPPPQQQGQQAPVEFDHAINYVTTIKRRFANEPDTYKKFLEILHTYQKEQRGIKEVLDEVSILFSEHPDLLKEFTYFLPDAVQAEAKVQLDQAAAEAEARKLASEFRKRASESKQAIMQQAQGMQQQAQQQQQQHRPSQSSPPQQPMSPPTTSGIATSSIAFGASQARSDDREREICRSAIYGTVSFHPPRPPQRNELTPAQAAAKRGRPQMIPELPTQPTVAEAAFLERAKLHLNRRELAPDKPAGSRRHTPYTEFLKCLHLFGAGILNKEELVLLLRGLFMQGHAPKSGVNAGGGASNPSVATDAQELLREFEEILVGRGHFAEQENELKNESKYGDKQVRDFEFSGCEKVTPSYRTMPADYPYNLFHSHSGQSGMDASVLNSTLICVPARRGPRMVWSPDEYDGPAERHNIYEENMFKVEDERFEMDMAIERNVMAMRMVEPIAEEVTRLRENEEKDGQPIGRMQYKLRSRQLRSDQANAIARLYGDRGDEVLQHLSRNPVAVLPIVYQRLRQKDAEWRRVKSELMKRWNDICEKNYEGSLDATCWFYKQDLEQCFDDKKIIKVSTWLVVVVISSLLV